VSVIVPTHNGREPLLTLLESLRAQTLPPERFELVVIVDGSTDGTAEALDAACAPFVIRHRWQENRGRAAAVNAGVELARGERVVLLDDDLEPVPDFLAAHLRHHGGGRRIGVVGAVRSPPGGADGPFPQYWMRRFEHFLAGLEQHPEQLSWAETYTGAFSVRRADFIDVGGFAEAFDGYGLEDFELALRLVRSGVELRLSGDATAYHGYDKDFAVASREAQSRGRSAVIFGSLHPEINSSQFGPRDLAPPSIPRRTFRYVLPRMTGVLPILPRIVRSLVAAAERRGGPRLELVYTLGLEYFFFVGLRRASRR
jgi:glycosyltransferase involved in cell wall biosynthesis